MLRWHDFHRDESRRCVEASSVGGRVERTPPTSSPGIFSRPIYRFSTADDINAQRQSRRHGRHLHHEHDANLTPRRPRGPPALHAWLVSMERSPRSVRSAFRRRALEYLRSLRKKGKAKVRDEAPRGQTENTTRDLRSYRVELFLLTCISVHQMKFLLRVRVLRDILMRSTLVLGGRSSHLLVLRARSMVGLAPRRLGSGSKGGDKKIKFERSTRDLHLDDEIERENRHRPSYLDVSPVRQFVDRCRFLRYVYSSQSQPTLSPFPDGGAYLATFLRLPSACPFPSLPGLVEKIQFCQPGAGRQHVRLTHAGVAVIDHCSLPSFLPSFLLLPHTHETPTKRSGDGSFPILRRSFPLLSPSLLPLSPFPQITPFPS